jgi:hypothetical protein
VSAETPFACRFDAFPSRARARHAGLIDQLRSRLGEVRELPDGYAFRFADDGTVFGRLAEWVRLESICCSFLRFELKVERRSGPVWLSLTGGKGVKEFLRNQFPIAVDARG